MHSDHFAFIKLFQTVNERYSREYVDKVGWQYSNNWTVAERDIYVSWLASELKTKKIFNTPKEAEVAACFWIYKNGWQIKG
jgi:hypothetical protein